MNKIKQQYEVDLTPDKNFYERVCHSKLHDRNVPSKQRAARDILLLLLLVIILIRVSQ